MAVRTAVLRQGGDVVLFDEAIETLKSADGIEAAVLLGFQLVASATLADRGDDLESRIDELERRIDIRFKRVGV